MKVKALGHVVLRVTNRERAEQFYSGLLGLPICARFEKGNLKMAFFTLGNHHDFAVMEVSGEGAQSEKAPGLDHVAFKIGDSLDELREAKKVLEAAGLAPRPVDHEVTKSLYFSDPDGNGVELYIDASDAWRRDPGLVAQIHPLEL